MTVLTVTIISYALWTTRQVSHSGIVIVTRNFKIFTEFACIHELTAIDWSDIVNGVGQAANFTAYVKNLDAKTVYVNWNLTAMPAGITLKMWMAGVGESPYYNPWDYNTLRMELDAGWIRPIRFELSIGLNADEGIFSYTQFFYGFNIEFP